MRVFAILLLAIGLVSCGFEGEPSWSQSDPIAMIDELSEFEPRVDTFHAKFNASRFDEIYADAGVGFEDRVDLRATSEEMGAVVESCLLHSSKGQGPSGTKVQLAMDTRFDRGQAYERFDFTLDDGEYYLTNYRHISEDQVRYSDAGGILVGMSEVLPCAR